MATNGAGKSGYARILKHACRARMEGKGHHILPNIDTPALGRRAQRFHTSSIAKIVRLDWQLDKPTPSDLSAVSVFDTGTARLHVDGVNDVASFHSLSTSCNGLQRSQTPFVIERVWPRRS